MKLFAVLIGINAYELSPLQQCVNDVTKFENYLLSLGNHFDKIELTKLIDENATKENIITTIQNTFQQATNNDVTLLYYSGHGAVEHAKNRFSDAHSNTIECMVCYDKKSSDFLLADKELRYIFSKLKHDPHLITVFDCCHSGDIVRNISTETNNHARAKRITEVFPARDYEKFIFSKEIEEEKIVSSKLAAIIPFKNSIHIAACLASESSWEDAKGGVFTRYLLQLLSSTSNRISYLDIVKSSRISLKNITQKKQTPTLSLQGNGKLSHYDGWLSLYGAEMLQERGQIMYNTKKGWYYNKGLIHGVKIGTKVQIPSESDSTEFIAKVTKVNLEDSLIQDPFEMGVSLNFKKAYPVISENTHSILDLYIYNLDNDLVIEKQINDVLYKNSAIQLVDSQTASFFIVIFNQTLYLSLPNAVYQPIATQIDLIDNTDEDITKRLNYQLQKLIKWNHYHTLENPDNPFHQTPIKVEIRIDDKGKWKDITSLQHDLSVLPNQLTKNGEHFQKYQCKVTNTSQQKLFVSVLLLSSDISISSAPFDHSTKELQPGHEVLFYEHQTLPYSGWSFDSYKEIYNWKYDWVYYKFIVTMQDDITSSLPDMNQSALTPPISHLGNMMGHTALSDLLPEEGKWDIYTSTLHLHNPNVNQITPKLKQNWNWYVNHDILAPFMRALYMIPTETGFITNTQIKNELLITTESEKGIDNLKIRIGNHLEDKRRYRRFKKAKKLFPELPVVVAEGDSWFMFPFLVKDTLDYVMEHYPLRSIAAAGDEIQNYRKSGQLIKEIQKEKPKYVLISGGGNDIIGPAIVDILKSDLPSGLAPAEYLNDTYDKKMDEIRGTYNYFFNRIHEFTWVKQVFIHGYDYVRADINEKLIKNGWVNRYLIEKGITAIEDRTNVIRLLINNFNELLQSVASQHKNTTYLDMRTLVNNNEWYDEIHPNDEGFAKIGTKFLNAINQLEYTT
ncbi:caspase family protein [Aquimarina sp. D1M17]|uniref:caspase family protein n=1 Tax=Aquimarina acroporae TaxID=2937283 RepID=UPI0020BDB096|nr:caspase family protein [Aquimarina acroporae]MCK8520046.1 caspase family protein [Aquimarina acroporae]